VRFQLVLGTSVGAIHACYVAATADGSAERGTHLGKIWRSFRLDEMLPLSPADLLRVPRRLLGLRRVSSELRAGRLPQRLYGALDTAALERVVVREIPWDRIQRNVAAGALDALCVTATRIGTGHAVVFVESRDGRPPRWTRDRTVVAVPARLRPQHALASAAIPLLFPAVRIGRSYYADGGLRLNTPLSPALRLGADRVLVIALRTSALETTGGDLPGDPGVAAYGSPAYLFGKVLNALLLDHVDTDLAQMHLMNEILRDGERAFGPQFLDRINAVAERERGLRFRRVEDLVLRPSRDLGVLAGEVLERKRRAGGLSPILRFFLGAASAGGGTSFEADLLSYLLFDHEFTDPVVELGYADAKAREEDLARFFEDAPLEERALAG
jgi:NTE family protein